MSIKVLGGIAKGQSLFVPKGEGTRPTSVQLRRKIFDSIQNLDGYKFYDLCAGTGAMGIEAWSRGADEVHFFENNFKAFQCLKKNLSSLKEKFPEVMRERPLYSQKIEMQKWNAESVSESIIFIDPPYLEHKVYQHLQSLLEGLLERDNFIWVESDKNKGLSLDFWPEKRIHKVYRQGDSYIASLRL